MGGKFPLSSDLFYSTTECNLQFYLIHCDINRIALKAHNLKFIQLRYKMQKKKTKTKRKRKIIYLYPEKNESNINFIFSRKILLCNFLQNILLLSMKIF